MIQEQRNIYEEYKNLFSNFFYMSKDKTSFEKFMKSLEKLSDDIVYAFYQEDAVKTIESVSFMKKLVKSSFVKSLYDF